MNFGRVVVIGMCAALTAVLMPISPDRCEAQSLKFAQVSLPEVYRYSKRLQATVEEVSEMRTNAQASMSLLAKEIKEIRDKLQKQKPTSSPEEEQKLKQELQDKSEKLEAQKTELRVKVAFKQKSVQNVLKVQIPTVLEEVAKKQGLSMIFWDGALAYGPAVPDVSREVAQAIDALPAVEKGPVQESAPKKP